MFVALGAGVDSVLRNSATVISANLTQRFIRAMSVSAMVAGVSATAMPAALSASIFPAAVPFPPETIAPAWPIRRPGGAVTPAMKAATVSGNYL